ncbi:MAG: hypothetical protein IRZ16_12960 [Myxococcaceae bacterium]|nr:hypothetical protein [Myxococcaceae bacterium]
MKRILVPAAAALMSLVGCVESGLNDDDAVVMSGVALNENKSPLTNTTLKLYRSRNSACILPDHYRDVETDSVGKYSLDLTGAETKNGDLARCFLLQIPPSERGATASVDFLMQVTEVEVPDLQVWNGAVAAAEQSDGAQVSFKKIFETHGFDSDTTVTVRSGNDIAWISQTEASPATLSGYVLEDAALTAQLGAEREVKGSGVAFHLHYRSDEVTLPQKQLVPVSRGAACTFGAQKHDTACPYTDGKFSPVLEEAANDLTVTFAQAHTLKKAVLRGFSHNIAAEVRIEGSADNGASWITLAKLPDGDHSYLELDLDGTAPAVNAVRIHVDGDQDPKILGLAEISLFE